MSAQIKVSEIELKKQKEIAAQVRDMNLKSGKQKTACVVTYGCQQNENDSERLKGMLLNMGYTLTEDRENANVILFNTCAVRDNAEQKLKGNVGALKFLKTKRKKDVIIGVCGCMAQQPKVAQQLSEKFRHIDMIFGTHSIYRFPEILKAALKKRVKDVIESDGVIAEDIPVSRDDKHKAWVSVMYGCNNFCTYCIVPYVRGRERSRDVDAILSEIKQLASQGYKEITLLGQNVNSYGKDLEGKPDFAYLLEQVNKIDGIERIRFATSHPKDISDRLISVMAECDKVCPQLHLPFQSGSNKVLRDMNRGYTREKYLEIIKKLREKIPDIALTSDVIVGFPTETNEDFEDTVSLVKEVGFDGLFTFIYSKRDGTKAALMEPVLSDEQIKKNFDRLLEVQNVSSKKSNDKFVGQIVEILVDGPSKNDPDTMSGRTVQNKVVNFKGPHDLTGKLINVKIVDAKTWSLDGQLL
ncbi:MAG: tRNA (N6-isopentenyl adenosine(37)-C2)-methylthiotransferase MiaB [Clostridia bacterium]|nr:tRNA (N6-isopentenyl adenosine(37)-C2)-methylthiotransferase MiaB [Clostridia bacterium]